MKELLNKLVRCTINITFKSGDRLEGVVIEAIMGNTIVANYRGELSLIEIPHIGYVTVEAGVMEVMEAILKKQEDKDDKKDCKKDK
jgi:hypothetical protein